MRLRVRVVEDSALSAALFVRILERAGHRVDTVTSKFERLLVEGVWSWTDVAIVDLRLSPKVTGADILTFLAEHVPRVRRIAVSGSDLKELARVPAHVALQKPIDLETLVAAVEET